MGRIDQQVKIRGFRIELGEIENHLLKHPAVDAALVLVRELGRTGAENAAQRYLCAYIAAKEKISVPDLREFLAGQLPAYMIPSHYVMLDRMPQTPHGKPDLKVLETYEPESGINSEFIAPGTDMEIAVADTWKELLNLETVGIHDNFFDLGGNSMLLLKVANKIGETLKREIPYVAMFQYTTIHALAEYLSTGKQETPGPEKYEEQAEVLDKGKERMKKFIKRSRETEVVNG
jgi:acyl carrier protein